MGLITFRNNMNIKEINNCFIDAIYVLSLYSQNNRDLNNEIKMAWQQAEKNIKRKWKSYHLNLK